MLDGLDETAIMSKFRQAVYESVRYMTLYRCDLDTSVVDQNVFRELSDFSEGQLTDILGTAVSSISEQALREIETTVKTIERRNQHERDNQEQDHQRNTPSVGRGDEDILSDSERGQGDRFDLYARSRNIRIPAEPDRDNGREGYRNLGNEKKAVSSEKQGMAVSGNVRQSHSDRSSGGSERSGGEHDGRSDGEDDGERGSEREAESGRLDGVGTQSELGTEQSGGNRVQQSDLRITQKPKRQRRTKRTEERTVSPVFSSFTQGEQISMFPAERTEQDIANEYAMAQIARLGTGFVDSKFRIAEYFAEGHTKQEKAKFLSDKYGTGGYAGGGERMDYRPGNGITMSRTDKDNPENNISVHLTYPQVVDIIESLIQSDRYITPQDIEKRQQNAIYILKTYDPNDPFEAQQIEEAKAVLDSYNIDYSQLLENQPIVETATAAEVDEMNAAIPDDADLPDINAPSVIDEPQETVYIESAVVAEFRNRTTESFHLINGKNEYDIELEVEELLRQEMQESNIAGEIKGVVLYGSRSRGLETSEDTDIDIVVQINNSELKEDALFNIFHDLDIQIDGIPVDVNPIRPEETGTLETYLPKAETYLEQKQAEKAEQVFFSSDGKQEQVELEVPPDSLSITIGESESDIIHEVIRRAKDNEEPLSYGAVNGIFEYLDTKQHLERNDPLLKAGWYKKTDFEIRAVIDGEVFTYSGEFDIGDGKGRGGGSITEHIQAYIEFSVRPDNPLHLSDERLAEQKLTVRKARGSGSNILSLLLNRFNHS